MSTIRFDSFADELNNITKEANKGGAFKALMGRLRHPIKGIQEGWSELKPDLSPEGLKDKFKVPYESRNLLSKRWNDFWGSGQHLKSPATETISNPKDLAENLSRSGWTGESRFWKYLPVGGKSQMTLGAGMELPGAYYASVDDNPDTSALGSIGSTVGFLGGGVLASGKRLGMVGLPVGIASGVVGHQVGSKLEKAIRKTPKSAPTPNPLNSARPKIQPSSNSFESNNVGGTK